MGKKSYGEIETMEIYIECKFVYVREREREGLQSSQGPRVRGKITYLWKFILCNSNWVGL